MSLTLTLTFTCKSDQTTSLDPNSCQFVKLIWRFYSIVGALSRDQSHAFSTALLFAHEYGILAASSEDRPFVPVSTVVLEGVPKDMKAVFRHWREIPDTAALMAGKPLSRGRSLRIVGLGAALKATGAS